MAQLAKNPPAMQETQVQSQGGEDPLEKDVATLPHDSVLVSVARSCPTLVTPWTVAHQAPLSMGFSRQVYWSGVPFPSPGELPDPGIKPRSPALQEDSLPSEPLGHT